MAHIHTDPGSHDFTVSAFIIRTDFEEPKIMLHKHKKLGKYMQFGGHVDPPDDLWEALVKEIREESGYEMPQLKLLQRQDRIEKLTDVIAHPVPMTINTHLFNSSESDLVDHHHIDIEYAFVTDEEPKNGAGENESQDFALFTREEILMISHDKLSENTREIILFLFDVCLPKWEQIPPR